MCPPSLEDAHITGLPPKQVRYHCATPRTEPHERYIPALTHVVAGALAVASVLLAGLAVEAYDQAHKDPGISVPGVFHMTFEDPTP